MFCLQQKRVDFHNSGMENFSSHGCRYAHFRCGLDAVAGNHDVRFWVDVGSAVYPLGLADWLPVCHPTCLSVNFSSSHSLRSCILGTFPFQPVLESSTIEIRPEIRSLTFICVMFIEYRFDTNRNNLSRFVSPHLQRRKAFLKLVRRSHLHLHLSPHPSQSRLYQRVCCCFFLYRWPPRGGFLIGHIILIKL